MIEGLRPYAEMKATGHPWMAMLPAHWEMRRNGRLFGVRRETEYPDLPILEVSIGSGVRVRDFDNGTRKQVIADRSKYQRAVRGDMAYNMMRMWQGAVGVAPVDGLVSPAYVVVKPYAEVEASYYAYLFRTAAYKAEIDSFSRGIVPDRNRLYPDAFKQMPSAYPPPDEQRLIVRFLDWHGAMTGRLIRAKRRLLELVAERRVALTEEVISSKGTREVRFRLAADRIFDLVSRDGDEGFTAVGLRNRGRGIFHKERRSGADLGDSTFSWIKAGDLILSGQFAWEGAIAVADVKDAGCIASHRYHIIRSKAGVENTYLWCFLRSGLGNLLLDEHSRGAAGRNRPLDALSLVKEKIPIPTHGEQLRLGKIVALEKQLTSIAEQYVGKLGEFRTRLIADVVTGQLDVRAVAATLPDLTEDMVVDEPLDDADPDETADAAEDEEVAAA